MKLTHADKTVYVLDAVQTDDPCPDCDARVIDVVGVGMVDDWPTGMVTVRACPAERKTIPYARGS